VNWELTAGQQMEGLKRGLTMTCAFLPGNRERISGLSSHNPHCTYHPLIISSCDNLDNHHHLLGAITLLIQPTQIVRNVIIALRGKGRMCQASSTA
jgi:hypothetical protein